MSNLDLLLVLSSILNKIHMEKNTTVQHLFVCKQDLLASVQKGFEFFADYTIIYKALEKIKAIVGLNGKGKEGYMSANDFSFTSWNWQAINLVVRN